jgi:hypothetical protein
MRPGHSCRLRCAVRANGFAFVNGYVPFDPETGKGVAGSIEIPARRTRDNLKLALEQAGSSPHKVSGQHLRCRRAGLRGRQRRLACSLTHHVRQTIGGVRVAIDCVALA